MRAYFARYPGFTYDPSKAATSEFRRLRSFLSRQRKDSGTEAPLRGFNDALGNQFGEKYGREWDDLSAWQGLCRRIGIGPIPGELEAARKVGPDRLPLVERSCPLIAIYILGCAGDLRQPH